MKLGGWVIYADYKLGHSILSPANGKTYTLEELQEAVHGNIEIIHLNDGRLMVVNEEGLLQRLPYNMYASAIAHQSGLGDIVGDVVVCHSDMIE